MDSHLSGQMASDGFVQQLYRFLDRAEPTGDPRSRPIPGLAAPLDQADPAATDQGIVLVPAPAALPSDSASLLGGADAQLLTLQIGLVQPVVDGVPRLIEAEVQESGPADGLLGGWVNTLLSYNSHSSLSTFVYALGGTDSWSGPAGLNSRLDTVMLAGDFSAGFTLASVTAGVTQLGVAAGNDYVVAVLDDVVGAGHLLTFDASSLDGGNHAMFDGSAETDGRFSLFGSEGNDYFFGGAGNDSFSGLGGADTLSGGGGADLFIYTAASESSGASYDTLADFDPTADRIDLPGSVSGFAAAIATGALSTASFDTDLGAVLSGLGAAQAVWFAPDAGELAGTIFLVVDANGTAGYQPGEDYVFAVAGSPLADLTSHTDIFV